MIFLCSFLPFLLASLKVYQPTCSSSLPCGPRSHATASPCLLPPFPCLLPFSSAAPHTARVQRPSSQLIELILFPSSSSASAQRCALPRHLTSTSVAPLQSRAPFSSSFPGAPPHPRRALPPLLAHCSNSQPRLPPLSASLCRPAPPALMAKPPASVAPSRARPPSPLAPLARHLTALHTATALDLGCHLLLAYSACAASSPFLSPLPSLSSRAEHRHSAIKEPPKPLCIFTPSSSPPSRLSRAFPERPSSPFLSPSAPAPARSKSSPRRRPQPIPPGAPPRHSDPPPSFSVTTRNS